MTVHALIHSWSSVVEERRRGSLRPLPASASCASLVARDYCPKTRDQASPKTIPSMASDVGSLF